MSVSLISAIYATGVDGIWLDADSYTRFKNAGATLTGWNQNFNVWSDRSGNARDVTETTGSNPSMALQRDTSYGASFGYSGYDSTAGGGSTTAFYAAFSMDARAANGGSQYYSTVFSDVGASNTGIDLKYNGDIGGWTVSVGLGGDGSPGNPARLSLSIASQALYTFEGRNIVEVAYDGIYLGLRVNKQYVIATPCSGITAGNLAVKLFPAWIGDFYEVVLFKNYCPSEENRNRIASYMSLQQAITGLPPFGDFAPVEPAVDTFASTGSATTNSLTSVEPANDTFAATGVTLARSGSLATTEPANDTFSAAQTTNVTVSGHGWGSDYGVSDTFDASSAATPRTGSMASTEPVKDTFAASGTALPNRSGAMAAVESGTDTFAGSSSSTITGSLATVESGNDVFSAVSPGASDTDFLAWLASDSRIATLLVEVTARVGGVETTRYLSSTGYTTGPAETPANTNYIGVIIGGGTTTEELPEDGSASMAFGDIEVSNLDGALDSWLDDVWAGRQCKVYVGDQRWARADFRLIFDGIVSDLTSRGRDVLNLVMRDKLERLNTAVTDVKLGGTSQNADRLLPLAYGEVHNIEPLLIDKALLKYQVNNGPIERLIEVRDFGMPVSATVTLADGTFTLNASPAGTITCSVQGRKPSTYFNTVSQAVQQLVTTGGADPFSYATDMDTNNLAAFDAAHPQPIGLYLTDKENVLDLAQRLAASVGAQLVMPATGKLRLLKITLPATLAATAVGSEHMYERSLELVRRLPVRSAIKLNYARNWTVQENLQTGILPEHKDLFAQEWLTVTASDSSVATIYKQTKEPEPEDTLLIVKADAENEANRKLALWKVQRSIYRYEARADLLMEELGGYQTITHSRYGMSSGVTGQIVKIERDWLKGRVTFEVLV